MTYNQSGFDLDEKRGHDKYAYVRFSKTGWVKIRYTRPIPDRATIKEVTFKKERTGEWFVSFGLETDNEELPEKPDVDSLDASNCIGTDLGILNCIHTSDGKIVDRLDLEEEYEGLRREQRKLSRKMKGSNNYEKQRKQVAKVKRHIRRKVLDYQHKTTTWLVKEYDAVFMEDLKSRVCFRPMGTPVTSRMRRGGKSSNFSNTRPTCTAVTSCRSKPRNDQSVRSVRRGDAEASLGQGKFVSVVCVRDGQRCERGNERSERGFSELRLGWPESTLVETVTATDTVDFQCVSVSHVIETGKLPS